MSDSDHSSSSSSLNNPSTSDDSEFDGKPRSTRPKQQQRRRPTKVKKTKTMAETALKQSPAVVESARQRRKPDQPQPPQAQPPQAQPPRGGGSGGGRGGLSTNALFFLVGLGLVAVAGFFLLAASLGWLCFKLDAKPGWNQELLKRLESSIIKLSATFPRQQENLWENIFEAVRHTRKPHERQPAVLLWVPLRGSSKTLDCIANRILRSFYDDDASKDAVKWIISSDSLSSGDASHGKTALDEKLTSLLGNPSLSIPVVLLKNIDQLSPAAASLLGKYCHRDAAWQPRSIVMLTLSEELSSSNIDLVYKLLRDRWVSPQHGIDRSQVDAILSHITIAPVFVENESDSTLQTNCP